MWNPRNSPPARPQPLSIEIRGISQPHTDDEEHAVRLLRVLDLRQELGRKTERQRDLGRLVEVRLEHVPICASKSRP